MTLASRSDIGTVVSSMLEVFTLLAVIFQSDFTATFGISLGSFRLLLVAVAIVFACLIVWFGLGHPTQQYTHGKGEFSEASLDKTEYHLGDTMICHVKFKGIIDNGFFDTVLYPPEGAEMKYVYDRATLEENAGPNTPGTLKLDGKERKEREDSWPCYLDPSWPFGDYIVQLVAFDHHFIGGRLREFAYYATINLGRFHMLVPRQTVWHRDIVAKKEFKVKILPKVEAP